jgi:hypothetical protein
MISDNAQTPHLPQNAVSGSAFEEIFDLVVTKIKESKHGYYLSWWIRLDFDGKYSTTKINYELSKAVKKGLLVSKSMKYGVEYRLT